MKAPVMSMVAAALLGSGVTAVATVLVVSGGERVSGARQLTVSPGMHVSATRSATLVGEEADADLALIKVDPSGLGLKPLKLVDSTSTKVGDTVYAIGNPYGLDETLTRGSSPPWDAKSRRRTARRSPARSRPTRR